MAIRTAALASLIEQSGMTLREIEERTGVDASTISEIRAGNIKEPRRKTVLALARGLNVAVDAIYKEEWDEVETDGRDGAESGGHGAQGSAA